MAQALAEKLEHTGPAKRKEWPQCHRDRSWQVRQSRPCQKEKAKSRLSTAPGCKVGWSEGDRELHFDESEEDRSRSMEWKGWTPR